MIKITHKLLYLWLMLLPVLSFAQICYPDAKSAYQAILAAENQQASNNQKININTATAGEFATLKGVGAKTAQAIVDYRQMFGNFSSVDDLTKVKGIGEKTLEKNRHRLMVY